MTYTIPLTHLNKNEIRTAGGKGANLGELTAAGFAVPSGFVLTTEAYEGFVRENDLGQRIRDLPSQVSSEDPGSGLEASAAVKALFLEPDIPVAVQADLLAAYEALAADFEETAVAVRSSATAEDLPGASFAGQGETYLNVRGPDGLLEAVKKCWASLWSARALSYRKRMGLNRDSLAMAVIVQRMVPAEVSGVLFTANPNTGDRDELVVNASFGLGEAIVSGQVTPDAYVLDRADLRVKETNLGTKEVMLTAVDTQLPAVQPVPQTQRNQAALSNPLVRELGQLGKRVEKHFDGLPQDIEWALAEGQLWLLQARPITNLPPPPLRDVLWMPPRPGTIWMRRQVVEHMPEPLSPLFDELYLQGGLDQSMEAIADYLSGLAGFDINVWDFIQPPFAATVNGYAYTIASFKFNWRSVPLLLRMYVTVLPKMIRHLIPYWRDVALPAYLATIERWKGLGLKEASNDELLRGVRELATADAIYWFAAAVPLGIARVTDAALDRFLKLVPAVRHLADGSRPTSAHYLRGFPSKAVAAQAQIEAIAKIIRGNEELRERVALTPAGRLSEVLAKDSEGQKALDELGQYLDEYGHQIYNLDFAAPTLADDPLPVLLSLKASVARPEQDIKAYQAQLAGEREALVAHTERSLNLVQRRIFRLLFGWAQRYTPNRETALFYVGAAWPALRALALELGGRLAEVGSLESPADVFYLRTAELASASAAWEAGSSRPELAELARERRILREARKRLVPPDSVPPDGRLMFGPIDMAVFEPRSRSLSSGPRLEGFAVSPGRVTGEASVILSPEEFDRMTPDTILVCPTTTPAWTPLFAQARGLVTDIGGALAHGSIVAREYGIPAVMGTGTATQRIKNGGRIQVDGDSGTVTLLDEIDAMEDGAGWAMAPSAPSRVSKKKFVAVAALAIGLALWWKKRQRR